MDVPNLQPGITTLSWESCPEELLRLILKQSCFKSLLACVTVNRRWMAIALDYIELYSLWPKIASEGLINKGRTFKRKSGFRFSHKDMCVNSLLWSFVSQANIRLHYTYALSNIKRIQVSKEDLILAADPEMWAKPIRCYNMRNKMLTRTLGSSEIDFRENQYMHVTIVENGSELHAVGKGLPQFGNHFGTYEMMNPVLYRLEDNVCYVLSKHNVVWALTWDGKRWDLQSRGRYYGNATDTVCGMNVYNDRVCLVTKLGFVVCEDPETKSYRKVNSNNLVASLEDSTVLELFSENGVAVSVNKSHERLKVYRDEASNFMWLECGDMTCATEHGEVLFIGYKDGTVAICRPHTMPPGIGNPDEWFNVLEFDRSIEDPSILAVEVFEYKMSHHLLVATQHKVHQLMITYPNHIKEYFERPTYLGSASSQSEVKTFSDYLSELQTE